MDDLVFDEIDELSKQLATKRNSHPTLEVCRLLISLNDQLKGEVDKVLGMVMVEIMSEQEVNELRQKLREEVNQV